MQEVLQAIWVFIPAGLANMSPVIINNISMFKKFSQPVDFGKTFRGKRILGDHKTYRGFISGIIAGLLTTMVQMILYNNFDWAKTISGSIDYSNPEVLLMGACIGFGALFGDSIKSFFKRQFGYDSGKSWFPFDQIDYIIGAFIASMFFVTFSWQTYIVVLLIGTFLHPIINVSAWILRLKDKPF